MTEAATKRRKRTNAEILADQIAERKKKEEKAAETGQKKRTRRTRAQIEADKLAEVQRLQEVAEKRAREAIPDPFETFKKIIVVKTDNYWQFGRYYNAGDEIVIVPGTPQYNLSFTSSGKFIFNLTLQEQLDKWGVVKYEVQDVSNDS